MPELWTIEDSRGVRAAAERFEEDFIWPKYGALGGPDTDECERIVRAVLEALASTAGETDA